MNAHPTLNGAWIGSKRGGRFSAVEGKLREAGFTRACAVALPGVGGYDRKAFISAANASPDFWVPVAAWESRTWTPDGVRREIETIHALGYKAVKLHPRLFGRMPTASELSLLIREADQATLPLFVCSYPFGVPSSEVRGDLLSILSSAMECAPQAKIVLLHAGCVDFLRFVEFARAISGIVLDLSFTMMKYEASSIDIDLRFAFRTFDERLCLGSDYPEFDPQQVRQRFQSICEASGIDDKRRDNIASRNAHRLFGIHSPGDRSP